MREVPFADPDVDEDIDIPAFLLPHADDEEESEPEGAEPGVLLPDAGTGERRYARRRRRRQSQRRTLGFVLLAVSVVAAMVLAFTHPWRRSSQAAPRHPAAASRAAPLPSSAVLVQQGADGGAASVTLLVANPTTGGGHIVFVPPATMTEVPAYGLDGVGKALGLGGPSLLQVTLENLLGVPLPPAVIVNDARLTSFLQATGGLDVDVPTRVEQTDAGGNVNVLWDQGPATLMPADMPRFLGARGEGNDLLRLARHQTLWMAWLTKVARDPSITSALPPDLAKIVRQLAIGNVSYETLPVEAVDAGSGGDEVYRIRQGDLDQLMGKLLPGVSADRIRVQVLNGTGAIGASPRVAERLIPVGGRVVLSGNADSFAYAQTQIVFYDRSQQQAAERVRQALGAGRLVLSRQPLDVVDVTVVIGKDFHA